jgi:hypothetical protein
MKRHFLLLASVSLLAAITFCACDKDDDKDDNAATSTIPAGEYTIEVENGKEYNSDIDSVKLVIEYDDVVVHEVCSGRYAKGKVTLDLPESLPSKYLIELEDVSDEFPDDINVSNSSVKIGGTELRAYKKNGYYNNHVGDIYHGTDECKGGLMYANGDATITGSGKREETKDGQKISVNFSFNVNLKKGWNIIYIKLAYTITGKAVSGTYEMTTQAPAGAAWRYEEEDD